MLGCRGDVHGLGGMHGEGGVCVVKGTCVVAGGMRGCRGVHGCRGGVHAIRRDTINERAVRILLECILVI